MSPNGQPRRRRLPPTDNLYTAVLAVALLAVLATFILVAWKCYFQYGTFFKIP